MKKKGNIKRTFTKKISKIFLVDLIHPFLPLMYNPDTEDIENLRFVDDGKNIRLEYDIVKKGGVITHTP